MVGSQAGWNATGSVPEDGLCTCAPCIMPASNAVAAAETSYRGLLVCMSWPDGAGSGPVAWEEAEPALAAAAAPAAESCSATVGRGCMYAGMTGVQPAPAAAAAAADDDAALSAPFAPASF